VKIGIASICCALALTVQVRTACAAEAPDIDPEVMATSWEEQGDRFASLTLNGREIIKFKETGENHNGEALVEDMAAKLDELVKDNRFQPEKILPAKDGDMVAIRVDGNTVIRFPAPNVVDAAKGTSLSPLETSLKLANAIRSSFGASIIPQGFLKMVEIAQDGGVGKGVDHFSGSASWYGGKFNGRKTSDGTKYDQEGLTAAHRSLPFGTKLLVMNRKTGDSCVVKVNDRGPFVDGRVIDLSKGAAKQLNMLGTGVALVDCLVLELP
jgi:rare lipoprotein A